MSNVISFRLPVSEKTKLEKKAKECGFPVTTLIVAAIFKYGNSYDAVEMPKLSMDSVCRVQVSKVWHAKILKMAGGMSFSNFVRVCIFRFLRQK